MKIFLLDTVRKGAKIYIMDTEDDSFEFKLSIDENVKHSEGLFLYIEKILLQARMEIDDFDKFACIVGPGSFTGIRVGMSVIKGFNKVANVDMIPINMFELIGKGEKDCLIALNSTASSCYYGVIKKGEIVDQGVVEKDKLIELANESQIIILDEEQKLIDLEYNNVKVISDIFKLYRNAILDKLNQENNEFLPYYLQLSQAERNLENGKSDN